MKRLVVNIFIIIMGIICGLLLGYFRFPYLEDHHALILGLSGGLAIGFLLTLVFKRQDKQLHKLLLLSFSCLLILGLFAGIFYLSEQERLAEKELLQEKKALLQAELNAAYKKAKSDQLRLVDFEMLGLRDRLAKRKITHLDEIEVRRIQELCELLKPIENKFDSAYSPGRGGLLLHLLQLPIDSASRKEVIKSANFNYADLSYEDLSGSDLSEIQLKYANLKKSKLHHVKLNRAVLEEANLWGAELLRTEFRKAELVNCSLNWSQLNYADLTSAKMQGANLSYAFADNLKLDGAILKWAKIIGATFRRSSLVKTDLFRATIKETTISNSNLSEIKLFKSYLIKSNFTNSNLKHATVNTEWLSKLNDQNLLNSAEIKRTYSMDSIENNGTIQYLLETNR